jgi:hypothetical protein
VKREQAVLIANEAREEKQVPSDASVASAQLQYIELGEKDEEQPSRVRDVLAWLVRYGMPRGRWVELAVDDKAARVVRVRRSR